MRDIVQLSISALRDRVYLPEFPEKLFGYLLIEALLSSSSNIYILGFRGFSPL